MIDLSKKQIVFAVWIIHSLAAHWHVTPSKIYHILNDTEILDDYVIGCYDTLHTLGKEYLIEDISEFITERRGRPVDTSDAEAAASHKNCITDIYLETLDENIILSIADLKKISIRSALNGYYNSRLSEMIYTGRLNHKDLLPCEISSELLKNEHELFN